MSIADAILLSFFVMPAGWLALGGLVVLVVVACWPPKRNRYVR